MLIKKYPFLILFIGLCLFLAQKAWAAPAFVQANGVAGNSISFSSNVTKGDALYAFVTCGQSGTCAITTTSTNEGNWASVVDRFL